RIEYPCANSRGTRRPSRRSERAPSSLPPAHARRYICTALRSGHSTSSCEPRCDGVPGIRLRPRKDSAVTTTLERPAETEYAPFYAGYVERVPDGAVFEMLAGQPDALRSLLGALSAEQADFRPGPAEWSIKEVVGHINDTERVFAYRA